VPTSFLNDTIYHLDDPPSEPPTNHTVVEPNVTNPDPSTSQKSI